MSIIRSAISAADAARIRNLMAVGVRTTLVEHKDGDKWVINRDVVDQITEQAFNQVLRNLSIDIIDKE